MGSSETGRYSASIGTFREERLGTIGSVKSSSWHESLAQAIRDPAVLVERLGLPDEFAWDATDAANLFPLMVPQSYLARMQPGNPRDPLLLQVLPSGEELKTFAGYQIDPVGDEASRKAPGLLHKYQGRALMIATGACAVHCRYCFRRHYPYGHEPRRLTDWKPALDALTADDSIQEVILSGGDPLMLTDARLTELVDRLADISHVKRLRIHSRLPIVLPDRVTTPLIELLTTSRLTPIMVVHANHPNEVVDDCAAALKRLVRSGVTTLNQAVLLRNINDDEETLFRLSESLIDLGVIPYYLHQLDRVQGAAHFEVNESVGLALIANLQKRLPGYAVPRYVREVPGVEQKTPIFE